jgi:ADP-heptose:LPS heptosyltransferase
MQHMLVIRPRALGDVVLITPALRALKRGHPHAKLDVVTDAPYVKVLEGLAEVHRVWPMERTSLGTVRLIRDLRRRRYDAVVDFFCNSRTALITRAARTRVRAGYAVRGRDRAYSLTVPREVRDGDRREYSASTHVRLAEAVGGIADGVIASVAVPPDADARATRLFEAAGCRSPVIGLIAAGTWPSKTWPVAHAARLAVRLMDAGWSVLGICAPGESRVARTLSRLAPGIRLLPPGSVEDMICAVRRLAALVGTDSGPRHIAAAFGVPTYTWFGPVEPATWTLPSELHGYWQTDLPCRACGRTTCPHWSCMASLDPDEAADRVLAHLHTHVAQSPGTAAHA